MEPAPLCIPGVSRVGQANYPNHFKVRLSEFFREEKGESIAIMKQWTKLLVLLALMALPATRSSAQSIFATLTGVVSDATGGVVPNASVKLINERTSSARDTVSNAEGYYSFASVSIGDFTYKLVVEAKGFEKYEATGLQILGGEKRNLNVELKVGAATQTIEVTGAITKIVCTDSGEKSETLTSKELTDYIQVGSDAAEYIKIMPGFGVNNSTHNKANYTGEVIGINANGDAGSQSPLNNAYSYDGLPGNTLDITADGAHVSDPGCNCDTPVNPNGDMVSEFKVSTAYSAENQKGPIVISSVTKAGGSQFHGDALFSLRNYKLNANDALFDETGAPKPHNKYYYPEGQIGGPVLIPGTGFNKNRDKLFFFTAFEYYYQVLDTGLLRATVPTPAMLQGDFSDASLAKISPTAAGGNSIARLNPCLTVSTTLKDSTGKYICGPSVGATGTVSLLPYLGVKVGDPAPFPGGQIPAMTAGKPGSGLDANMIALMKLYPPANATPSETNPYNYIQAETFNQNNREWKTRVDYNISDNTKLFVRYSYQRELQQFPVGLWWRNGQQVPYPTPILGKNASDSVSTSLTHVFNPTMTNEFVFAYTLIRFPNVFQDPSKVDRTKVGYNYAGIFKNGVSQIPSFGQWGGETAQIFNPSGFEAGGPSQGLYANKYMPSVSDTVAKVWSTHTVKAGVYWEWIRNSQPASDYANGQISTSGGQSNSTGDPYADMAMGNFSGYTETSFDRINDEAYNTWEFFVQDDWKATKRLSFQLGMRFTHFQPWYDRLGDGFTIFNTSLYTAPTATENCAASPTFCGFDWHKKDPAVPVTGFPSRALFYQPRIGAAYDLFGTGKSVLRGSWGRYYFHTGQFTNGLEAAAGVTTTGLGNNVSVNGQTVPLFASELSAVNAPAVPSSPSALDPKDDLQAHTDFYNVTVSERTPWSSLLEVSYVGNRTRDIPNAGNGGSIGNSLNINKVPIGTMLTSKNGGKDPNNVGCLTLGTVLNACNGDQFRPLLGYGDLYMTTNNGYYNYNSLQVTWLRTKGRYDINLNYTYSRAMGIVGFMDQFNLANNYGVLSQDRPQIFNAAYHIDLPSPAKTKLVGEFVNGWQLSGITQLESGADLTGYSSNQNYNMSLSLNGLSAQIPGTSYNISNLSILGTPDIQLNPVLTCNPRAGLGPHQFINASCFAAPTTIGQNGPIIIPPMYGPAFFNWDMGIFKNFKITESKSVEFRVNGYNWLNHPLWSLVPGSSNLNLVIDPTTYTTRSANGSSTNPLFGVATDKEGHRIIQFQFKFIF